LPELLAATPPARRPSLARTLAPADRLPLPPRIARPNLDGGYERRVGAVKDGDERERERRPDDDAEEE